MYRLPHKKIYEEIVGDDIDVAFLSDFDRQKSLKESKEREEAVKAQLAKEAKEIEEGKEVDKSKTDAGLDRK